MWRPGTGNQMLVKSNQILISADAVSFETVSVVNRPERFIINKLDLKSEGIYFIYQIKVNEHGCQPFLFPSRAPVEKIPEKD